MQRINVYVLLLLFLLSPLAHSFGAIAVGDKEAKATDSSTEEHFITSSHNDPDSANKVVLNECNSKGLKFCYVASLFHQCGAYARSSTNSGTGAGTTRDEAANGALASCGQKECKVITVQCDSEKKI